ncbi:hypothetical protein BRARA_A01168 [Brassica rapa]|nr:hypothetical protein BRARA_A01168 [Brassica rapa]
MWIFECRDPSHTAFNYGLAACILLVLAHVTANFLGGCLCVVSRQDLEKSSANKQLAVASLIFSWDDGKLKIEERLWDFTSSGSVHRRNPLFHSRTFRCCLLHLCNCFNTRTDTHRPCLNKKICRPLFFINLTQC